MVKPVLLTYTKKRRNRKLQSEVKVTGNVVLMVDDETVQEFNIPVANINLALERKVKNYNCERLSGKLIEVSSHVRLNTGTKDNYNVARIYRQPETHYKENHAIRFPYFFNVWMIQSAMGSMLQNFSLQERVRIKPDNRGGKRVFRTSTDYTEYMDSIWGKARVVQSPAPTHNADKAPWGEMVIVHPVISKPRARLIKINN